jgi:HEAT repeat protein
VAQQTEKMGIPELVRSLANRDATSREKARKSLVAIGRRAVPSLIPLLSHRKPHVRWEAAKTLCGIADPLSAFALVGALDDRNGDVRWLAAEGLVALGQDGLQPLLAAMLERVQSRWFREGAHHVCQTLAGKRKLGPILRPVLAALNEPEPAVAAPAAAYAALARLRALP